LNETKPAVAWMDAKGGFHRRPRQHLFGLVDDSCSREEALWLGFTFEEALQAWREVTDKHPKPESVNLTGWGVGVIARYREMTWKCGPAKGTFACPICGEDAPHVHSGLEVVLHRDDEASWQRYREKEWEKVVARAAALEARYPWYTPLYTYPAAVED
jgi:hypothetical protein